MATMNRERARQWVELALIIQTQHKMKAPDTLGHVNAASDIAEELLGYAERLHRYSEADCNVGLNDSQRKRVETLRSKIKAIVELLGWTMNHFNTDPRGFAVYLKLPDGRYNSWGGQENGFGI